MSWGLYRRIDDTTHLNGNGRHEPRAMFGSKPTNANCHVEESLNWQADAERYAAELTPALQSELAGSLALPIESLSALPLLGWCESEKCFTFPEMDASGKVIGITRRFRDLTKKKMAFSGSSRGLTIPKGWASDPCSPAGRGSVRCSRRRHVASQRSDGHQTPAGPINSPNFFKAATGQSSWLERMTSGRAKSSRVKPSGRAKPEWIPLVQTWRSRSAGRSKAPTRRRGRRTFGSGSTHLWGRRTSQRLPVLRSQHCRTAT